ncbi:tetratricopeptide repeat protein [Nonlabens sp.]|uniref:tetratricopeptide repeat protein n=1 Tax=Nonlabens sp. TaxID=1888209 RepID=UPI003F4AEA0A
MMTDNILLEKFFKDQLNDNEKDLFEKRKLDPEFMEQLVLEKQLYDTFNDNSWSFANSVDKAIVEDYQESFESEDIQKLKNTLDSISSGNTTYHFNWKPLLFAAAAIVVIILSISGFNNDSSNADDLYAAYFDKNEVIYSVVRSSENETTFNKASELYLNGDYKLALPLINETITNFENDLPTLLIMKGISLTELGSYEQAAVVYDELIESNYIDSQKGYWYKGLLILKKGEVEKALVIFNKIKNEELYNSSKASEIIEILED